MHIYRFLSIVNIVPELVLIYQYHLELIEGSSRGLGVRAFALWSCGFKPRQRPLVMLGRASSHNCSCASFEQVLSPF